jgi:hypothetical protein
MENLLHIIYLMEALKRFGGYVSLVMNGIVLFHIEEMVIIVRHVQNLKEKRKLENG